MDEKWKEEMIAIVGKDVWDEQYELKLPKISHKIKVHYRNR